MQKSTSWNLVRLCETCCKIDFYCLFYWSYRRSCATRTSTTFSRTKTYNWEYDSRVWEYLLVDLFWSYPGLILVLLLHHERRPTWNVVQMSDLNWFYSGPIASLSQQSIASLSCDPIQSLLNNPQLHFLVIQSKVSQKFTASLSCDPIQSLLNNPPLHLLVIQSKAF